MYHFPLFLPLMGIYKGKLFCGLLVDWEREERKMPDYLLRLMMYKLETEKLVAGLVDEVPDKDNMIGREKKK